MQLRLPHGHSHDHSSHQTAERSKQQKSIDIKILQHLAAADGTQDSSDIYRKYRSKGLAFYLVGYRDHCFYVVDRGLPVISQKAEIRSARLPSPSLLRSVP